MMENFVRAFRVFMYIKENIHDTNEKFYLIKKYLCKYILYHISNYLFYAIMKIAIYFKTNICEYKKIHASEKVRAYISIWKQCSCI
jgi:hypothetical protein